jgi:hypothetical protein
MARQTSPTPHLATTPSRTTHHHHPTRKLNGIASSSDLRRATTHIGDFVRMGPASTADGLPEPDLLTHADLVDVLHQNARTAAAGGDEPRLPFQFTGSGTESCRS